MAGAIDRNSVTLRLNRDVEIKCYPPVAEFLRLITELFSGEVQGSFGDVVISNITPEPEEVNKLWVEVNGQRNQFFQKVYVNGKWQPWYFMPPQSYILFDGRTTLPDGFKELGRFKTTDVPVTSADTAQAVPVEMIIASFIGY